MIARLLVGLIVVWQLFHWTASALGSDRGQYGVAIGAIVVAALIAAEVALFRERPASAFRALGLGRPRGAGLGVAAAIGGGLLLVYPLFSIFVGAPLRVEPRWWTAVPGLFAQAGIAEEALFRGYLFRHLHQGRSFWRAALLAAAPFTAVHLLLLGNLDAAVAVTATILAVILSFPLAYLFELGGRTIWAPALLHFVVQGAAKIVTVPDGGALLLAFMWMASSAVLPLAVFAIPLPRGVDAEPAVGR